jgi:hypothetical protein
MGDQLLNLRGVSAFGKVIPKVVAQCDRNWQVLLTLIVLLPIEGRRKAPPKHAPTAMNSPGRPIERVEIEPSLGMRPHAKGLMISEEVFLIGRCDRDVQRLLQLLRTHRMGKGRALPQ